MKKKIIICLGVLLVLLIVVVSVIIFNNNPKIEEPFYLEEKYYEKNDITEISNDELNKLVDKKESFVVFVYQPLCAASSKFEDVLLDFLKDNQVGIYKIAFSNIKDTKLGKKIKYYPSFIIYHEGKIVNYLRSNKDEDVDYFTSKEDFKKWLTKYVILKNSSSNN